MPDVVDRITFHPRLVVCQPRVVPAKNQNHIGGERLSNAVNLRNIGQPYANRYFRRPGLRPRAQWAWRKRYRTFPLRSNAGTNNQERNQRPECVVTNAYGLEPAVMTGS
jgi:hypothetical protein